MPDLGRIQIHSFKGRAHRPAAGGQRRGNFGGGCGLRLEVESGGLGPAGGAGGLEKSTTCTFRCAVQVPMQRAVPTANQSIRVQRSQYKRRHRMPLQTDSWTFGTKSAWFVVITNPTLAAPPRVPPRTDSWTAQSLSLHARFDSRSTRRPCPKRARALRPQRGSARSRPLSRTLPRLSVC